MALKLHYIPDPVLRKKAQAISTFDSRLVVTSQQMLAIMYHEQGIGLAGPQAGISERIVVMDLSDTQKDPNVYINPEIIAADQQISSEEGCLSIPGFRSTIKRFGTVTVRYYTIEGNEQTIEATGLLARCFQHEIDHLDGILFTDHLKGLNRKLYNRWEKRYLANELEEEE